MSCLRKQNLIWAEIKAKTRNTIFNCNFLFLCLPKNMRVIFSEIIWTIFLCRKSQKCFCLLLRPLESSYSYLQDTEKLMSSCFLFLFTCKFSLNFLFINQKSVDNFFLLRQFIAFDISYNGDGLSLFLEWSIIFYTMSFNSPSKEQDYLINS